MKTVSMSEARASLAALVDEVASTHEIVRITRRGHAAAVLISPDDLESLHETLAALSRPHMLSELGHAQDDFRAGRTIAGDDLRRRFGLDV